MLNKLKTVLTLLLIISASFAYTCTIGVSSADVTEREIPMVWKIRDVTSYSTNNISFFEGGRYSYIGVTNPGDDRIWMGANEAGFAIVNSFSADLTEGNGNFNNGNLIRNALAAVGSVDEFEQYISLVHDIFSDLELRGNFAVFDAQGASKMFEISNSNFWVYDTDDVENNTIIRTNFSINGGGTSGMERYFRANTIVNNLISEDELTSQNIINEILRDITDINGTEVQLPYSFGDLTPIVNTSNSICRDRSISAIIIEGVPPGVNPKFTTLWLAMGNPLTSVLFPVFPFMNYDFTLANEISSASSNLVSLFWNQANNGYLNTSYFVQNNGFSLLESIENHEEDLFEDFYDYYEDWTEEETDINEIAWVLNRFIADANEFTENISIELTSISDTEAVLEDDTIISYPNPFKNTININYSRIDNIKQVNIYNLKGQSVKSIRLTQNQINDKTFTWDGRDNNDKPVSSGLYFAVLKNDRFSLSHKILLIK